MIRKEMYEKVQLFKRLGYSRSKISSDPEIDLRTTAKYYAMDGRQFKTYQREHMFRDKMLVGYRHFIKRICNQLQPLMAATTIRTMLTTIPTTRPMATAMKTTVTITLKTCAA